MLRRNYNWKSFRLQVKKVNYSYVASGKSYSSKDLKCVVHRRRPSSVVRRPYLLSSHVNTLAHRISTFYCTYTWLCRMRRRVTQRCGTTTVTGGTMTARGRMATGGMTTATGDTMTARVSRATDSTTTARRGTTTRYDDGNARHDDGDRQQDDGQHNVGMGQHGDGRHDVGNGQQINRRHDDTAKRRRRAGDTTTATGGSTAKSGKTTRQNEGDG